MMKMMKTTKTNAKRVWSVLLLLALALTVCLPLAACGKKNEGVVASLPDGLSGAGQKILILYYSSANTNGVDVVSAATPYFDGVASTELLALAIQKLVGGDLAKLTPVQDYPESYNDTTAAAKKERDDDQRPAFVPLEADPADYDVIFVGYPMWWYTLPMLFYTFFDQYDLSGKVIVPFNTHAGSGDGGTYGEIVQFEPNTTVLQGLAVSGKRADKAEADVKEWLAGLGFAV